VPITHTNAKGQTFSLYQGTTKTGKPRHYFAMQSEGTLATAIPAGYEIYENPNARSCPSSLRVNTRGLPSNRHKNKKA
jgi:hypothetical protein